jgi:MoaA/NifB/PqqE/SkfB family radical SAM enzyme
VIARGARGGVLDAMAYTARMPPPRAIELALDYRCNLRCLGCRACEDRGERLSGERAAAVLREARAAGARSAWFGGGEPTLRDDLLALVRRARALGYEEVCVQTNALRLAYADYARALVEAGATEIRVNAKSHRAPVHDRLSRLDGAHALLLKALENVVSLELPAARARLVADVLLARSTVPDLPETVAFFAERGVRAFWLWLLSAADAADDDDVAREVPRIADVVPAIARADAVARERGVALASLHTPPCTLPVALRGLWQPAADLGMTVVDARGQSFPLASSPFEGGAHAPVCASCAVRDRCGGPRADYVRLHGAREFRALPQASVPSHGPSAQ